MTTTLTPISDNAVALIDAYRNKDKAAREARLSKEL
jgi:hypothetical protein